MPAYLKLLLSLEHLGQGFAGVHTQSVSHEDDLLDVVVSLELRDVFVHVGSRVEFQGLALERKCVDHDDVVKVGWKSEEEECAVCGRAEEGSVFCDRGKLLKQAVAPVFMLLSFQNFFGAKQ